MMITPLLFTIGWISGMRMLPLPTFESQLQALLLVYKRFITPVDRRPIYRTDDPAAVEGRRRGATILAAAEGFDPKGFDLIEFGLAKRYRRDFVGGLRLAIAVSKRNAKTLAEIRQATAAQVKAYTMYADFIADLKVYHADLFPKDYDKPYPIPKVWCPPAKTP